jgi:hypothetical protein
MTKKDFKVISDALYNARDVDKPWNVAVIYIAEALAADNEQFDRTRFYAACGLHGEKRK